MAQDYCSLGISVGGLRSALLADLRAHRRLINALGRAAGIQKFKEIIQIAYIYGMGLLFVGVDASGETVEVRIDLHIDDVSGRPEFFAEGTVPDVRQEHCGSPRRVTVAPKEWFNVKGNARIATNMTTLEDLRRCGSADLKWAIDDALTRADRRLAEVRRPKMSKQFYMRYLHNR